MNADTCIRHSRIIVMSMIFVAITFSWWGYVICRKRANRAIEPDAIKFSEARQINPLIVSDLAIELVYIPPGEYLMGSNEVERDEKPIRDVQITQGYWLGKTEVTNEQYNQFVFNSGYDGKQDVVGSYLDHKTRLGSRHFARDERPVIFISHNNSSAFCSWLTDREQMAGRLPLGYVFRLPTEAEWEYAARGGALSDNYTYSGSNSLETVGWYVGNSGSSSVRSTRKTGAKQPNELGLYDMSGNVWEWCHDWYDPDYYVTHPTSIDPAGPRMGEERVIRGGSWLSPAEDCRVANRNHAPPLIARHYIGFRVCLGPVLDDSPVSREKSSE
jgi:formylglycine-generating enzyme required for sulfatase activity